MSIRVFAINPGSTSTKIALFEDDQCLFSKNVAHDAAELAKYSDMPAQLPYRRDMILKLLEESNVSLAGVDVFVGRGGGLVNIEGGVYNIDDMVLEHARTCANGVVHPATLGPQLADEFARRFGAKAMVVNPPDTDEFQDLARMTGLKGVYRVSHLHALNLKETAIRHAREVLGRRYEDCNFIVCHIGGGISVSAHRGGKMVDGNDIVGGDGPMAPTRCGNVPVYGLLDYMQREKADIKTLRNLATRTGGFVNHIGISDAVELTKRTAEGDQYAAMLWNTMIYQIEKEIGAMAAVLHGRVDGILLGGGMVHSKDLVQQITDSCAWIAPVTAYPGEFEMEAMAAGAIRVLKGEETLKTYTGERVFDGFDFAK